MLRQFARFDLGMSFFQNKAVWQLTLNPDEIFHRAKVR